MNAGLNMRILIFCENASWKLNAKKVFAKREDKKDKDLAICWTIAKKLKVEEKVAEKAELSSKKLQFSQKDEFSLKN